MADLRSSPHNPYAAFTAAGGYRKREEGEEAVSPKATKADEEAALAFALPLIETALIAAVRATVVAFLREWSAKSPTILMDVPTTIRELEEGR